MTGRRRPPSLHRSGAAFAACAALSASLVSGCGPLPLAAAGPGNPVIVMTWAPEGTAATNMPGMTAMARTYARWVNASGGIDGRELKVVTCNERNNGIEAGHCAQRAVAEGAAAVVGSYSQHGRTFMSPLEMAGIPYIGGYGVTDEEFTSPFSYPVNGGQAALLAGNGQQLARTCERVTLVRPDTVAGDRMVAFINAGLAQDGRHEVTDVLAPEDAEDYTAQARAAGVRPGEGKARSAACVTAVLGDRTDDFFRSFRKLHDGGRDVQIASVLGGVGQDVVNRTGGEDSPFDGAFVTGWYPEPGHPRWEPMRAVVRGHADGEEIDTADPGVQTTWIAYTVLRVVIESLGDSEVTAGSVRRALDRGIEGGVDTGGVTPKLSWRYEDLLAVRDHPRMANAMVTYLEVRHGRVVPVRNGFVSVAETLESNPEDRR
ncbi:ABC transporter substrate-binding protein [Streptomyces atacamensis]|uniref:ABC transporter substrate-binding protein n=1 Tax=Streptomyces atacamensis TaxID=531966 RepID=UPI00399CC50A